VPGLYEAAAVLRLWNAMGPPQAGVLPGVILTRAAI
jgi:hypothetical protein